MTGGTGLVGNRLVSHLLAKGHTVRALVRNASAAAKVLPAEVELVRGDVTDLDSLRLAVAGADWVFHAAGMPEQWQPDESVFDRVNRQGTVNVLQAAQEAGVARLVYTSTMDVFAAPRGGTLVETRLDQGPKPTAYERSKVAADREVQAFVERGLDVVHINPSAVYGPSPVHVSLNTFIIRLLTGQVPVLPPGGMSVVYVDDVAAAHVAAAEQGRRGERYLVSGGYVTMSELAAAVQRAAGSAHALPPVAPAWALKVVADVAAPLARRFGFDPLVAPGQLAFMLWQARVDAAKAERELGFVPTPFPEALARTIASLQDQGLLKAGR